MSSVSRATVRKVIRSQKTEFKYERGVQPAPKLPAINRATDTGAKGRFKQLHRLSVVVTLVHILLAGYVLARFAGGLAA